jgi:hypothetical protein
MQLQIHKKDILPSSKPSLKLGYCYNRSLPTNRFRLKKSYNSHLLVGNIHMMQNYFQLVKNMFRCIHSNKYSKDRNLSNSCLSMFHMQANNNIHRMQWYNLDLRRMNHSCHLHIDNKEYNLSKIDLSKSHKVDSLR